MAAEDRVNTAILRRFLLSGLRRALLYGLMLPIYAASWLFPRDPRVWAFGADDGQTFGGNARYLADFVQRKLPQVRAVWFASRREACQNARAAGLECVHPYSLKGIYWALKAKVYFITHHLFDVNPYVSGGAEVVQLWHGLPLKKIEFDTVEEGPYRRFLLAQEPFGALYRRAHTFQKAWVVATSEETAKLFQSSFLVPRDRIWITGYPRTDPLFDPHFTRLPEEESFLNQLETLKAKFPGARLGLYAPTFRWMGEGPVEYFLADRGRMAKLEAVLEAANLLLWVKLHPWEAERLQAAWPASGYRRVFAWPLGIKDPYAVLNGFDFLVTDYSSIYFDYLLTDRPMVFFAYDLEQYQKQSRELNFRYEEVTPGPRPKDFNAFLQVLSRLFEEDRRWQPERRRLRERFFAYRDGKSSARVAGRVLEVLGLEDLGDFFGDLG